ncbi:MAG: cation transporter [Coriobacteriales bacterium]|nr:cation transporter [Coriobacteriales bacterium]
MVAFAKLGWGVATGSSAMQADGFHSLFDGTSNVVGLIGMGLAARPADKDHPYGHSKYETYASAAIGAMLVFAAFRIGSEAIQKLSGDAPPPTVDRISFAVMFVTLAVNLVITVWERRIGKKLKSEILVADASHTASDAFVSVGVIISLVFVQLGYPKADPIVALLVSGAIIYTAWGVFKQAGETLSDRYRIEPSAICDAASGVDGVLGCHHVRTRGSEAEVYVDLHIQVDPGQTVAEGHDIAERAERAICDAFPNVADVIVHLEPMDTYQAAKTAREADAGLA